MKWLKPVMDAQLLMARAAARVRSQMPASSPHGCVQDVAASRRLLPKNLQARTSLIASSRDHLDDGVVLPANEGSSTPHDPKLGPRAPGRDRNEPADRNHLELHVSSEHSWPRCMHLQEGLLVAQQ